MPKRATGRYERSTLGGEVRRSQNWIGGSRPGNAAYVPPPPHALGEVLGAFEKYLHVEDSLPPLVRAGLLHVQFETIHPYLDGNGRIGRLLVALLLEHWKLLTRPLLYLRLFFKRRREDYYRRLNSVRVDGDWEVTVGSVMKLIGTTKPTAGRAIELLSAGGVLVETTGKKRDRSFAYQRYLDHLRTGTELSGPRRSRIGQVLP